MKKILIFIVCMASLVSCVDTEERSDTPMGNFEALWQIIDEHYCFFDYKKHEYGLDWQEVYNKYKVRVNDNMRETQLFEVLCDMLSELRDGHVNLSSSYDYGRYWTWQEAFPKNFSDSLERKYLGTDYKISSGISCRVFCATNRSNRPLAKAILTTSSPIFCSAGASLLTFATMAEAILPMQSDWRHVLYRRKHWWVICSIRLEQDITISAIWNRNTWSLPVI